MVFLDARGLPVAVDTLNASPHESKLVQGLFDFMLTQERTTHIIGNTAYDSDRLDRERAERGIEMIAPHQANRYPENRTQDGRALRRYKRPWTDERTIGWIQNFRRLCIQWEKYTMLFQGAKCATKQSRTPATTPCASPPQPIFVMTNRTRRRSQHAAPAERP